MAWTARRLALLAAAGLLCTAGVEAEAASHLVYVARLASDGTLTQERNLVCDARSACEIALDLGKGGAGQVMLRIFAEDSGGVSLVPISCDEGGHFALGRRQDVAWSRARSANATVAVRPMRLGGGEGLYDAVMREDQPALATLMVAVREIAGPAEPATQ